ncbi:uncharacterized protein abca12 [Engraulis encrasicolus]|uniref:uncharacterized protein abca12 n=1 Tax=Engraulis encrasicolus TaxID=184585 RepID=UPI002FD1156E
MASFFHQLRLLLWKNGLSVIRQPGWSLALLIWPLVIFIILAITRSQFPPKIRDTCYVAPRNLPSAGFFPFLQTLMCNTDTSCSNHSRLSGRRYRGHHGYRVARDTAAAEQDHDHDHPGMVFLSGQPAILTHLQEQGLVRKVRSTQDAERLDDLTELWNMLINPSSQSTPPKDTLMAAINQTIFLNKGDLHTMLRSVDQLKHSFCKLVETTVDPSQQQDDPLVAGLVTFCNTNDTFLEVSLIILNKVLTQLVLDNPTEVFNTLGVGVAVFEALQKQESFWDLLLDLPDLFLLPTTEEKFADAAQRMEYLKSTMASLQSTFPQVNLSLATVNPVIEGGISLLKYMSTWSGKDVYIHLKDVLKPFNASAQTSDVMNVIESTSVPLTEAVVLLDQASFRSYVCDSGNASSSLQQACSSGLVIKIFNSISPQKVVEQALLAWGDGIASSDVQFTTQLLSKVLKNFWTPAGSTSSRAGRYSLEQPWNTPEKLFDSIGSAAIQLLQGLPGWDIVRSVLMGGHASMQLATQIQTTQQELMGLFLKDAKHIQATAQGLMHDYHVANAFAVNVTNSAINGVIQAVLGQVDCSNQAAQWSWMSSLSSLDPQLWHTLVCSGNGSQLENILIAPLLPVIQKVNHLAAVIEGTTCYNVTTSMLLEEWHKVFMASEKNAQFLPQFFSEIDQAFFDSFVPTNITVDWLNILTERALDVVDYAETVERLWPVVVPYFKLAYYIMTYQPNVTAPPNCTMDQQTSMPHCDINYTSEKFIAATKVLIEEVSGNPAAVLRLVQGSLVVLQSTYRDFYITAVTQLLSAPGQLPGDGSIANLLGKLIHVLDKDIQLISKLMSVEQFASHLPMSLLNHMVEVFKLKPLEQLWNGATNASSIIDAILAVAQNNQYLLSGLSMNQSDPSSADLAALIMNWLQSSQFNFTMPISVNLSNLVLTYSAALSTTDLAFLEQVWKPLLNQTTEGIAHSVLRALMLLREVVSASDGDMSEVVLTYVQQLQAFLVRALQLQQHVQLLQPGGGLGPDQITDLKPVVMSLLQTLSPQSVQALSSEGWLAVVDAVLGQLGQMVPHELQAHYQQLVNDTRALLGALNHCQATGQDCAAGVSQVGQILYQVSETMLAGPSADLVLQFGPIQGNMTLAVAEKLLALFRPWTNASSSPQLTMESIAKVLNFLQTITSKPNITVAGLQEALSASNLTVHEIDQIAQLAMNQSVSTILSNLTAIASIQQCLTDQSHKFMNSTEAGCALKMIQTAVWFLQTFPLPQETKSNLMALKVMIQIFTERMGEENVDPGKLSAEIIRQTLQNIKESLKNLNYNNTDQIINELNVLDGIVLLGFHNQYPNHTINQTMMGNMDYAQKVYSEIAQWYLTKLENVTSGSMFSDLLFPIFRMTQLQIALNLAQSDFDTLVTQQVEGLISQVQLPLDGHDLRQISHAVIKILHAQLDLIKSNLKLQQDYYDAMGIPMNITIPKDIEEQIMMYVNLTQKWTSDPSFTSALATLLQLDLNALNGTVDQDILELIKAMIPLLSVEQRAYLTAIEKAYEALIYAVQAASYGDVQSANFTMAIENAVGVILDVVSSETGALPNATIQHMVAALSSSLQLILNPNMSYAQSVHLSLVLSRSMEDVITALLPREAAEILAPMTNVITTYFEAVSQPAGPDAWNILVVNIMKGLMHTLPQNNTVQPYISLIVGAIEDILNSTQGNSLGDLQNMGNLTIPMAIEGAVGVILELVSSETGALPNATIQHMVAALSSSLQLILNPNMSYAQSVHLSLVLSRSLEDVITALLPREVAEIVAPMTNVITTYFEAVSQPAGPDAWNILVVNIMKGLMHTLPQNNTVQPYLSLIVGAIEDILNSTQGNSLGDLQNMGNLTIPMAIEGAVGVILELVSSETGALPNATIQHMVAALSSSLQLILNPNMSYAQSVHLSLVLSRSLEDVITALLPRQAAEILAPMTNVITTYFEAVSQPAGPDAWNILVVNIMKGLMHTLPQNNTVQPYLSLIVRAIEGILTQGNNSLGILQNIGNLNLTDIGMISEQLEGVLASLLPLLGDQVQGLTPQLGKAIADTVPVLLQVMNGQANQHTFKRLEKIVAVLLSTIRGSPAWSNETLHAVKEVIAMMAHNLNAQAELIHSMHKPLVNLTLHLLQAVNTSSFDMADFFGEFQAAVQNTVEVVIQTSQEGRAVNCSDVVTLWEKVGKAAGLPPSSLHMWCNINLQSLLNLPEFTPFNATAQSAQSVNDTAADIVKALASLYNASLSQSSAVQQLVTALTHHLSSNHHGMTMQAQQNWMDQMLQMQLYQSLSGVQMALDQVGAAAPWLRPYVRAVQKATEYTLLNSNRLLNGTTTQQVLMEALEVLLTGMNYTQESIRQILSGRFNGSSIDQLLKSVVKEVIQMRLLGDWPMAYGLLEQVLMANGSDVVLNRVMHLIDWMVTTEETGIAFFTHMLPKVYDVVQAVLEMVSQIVSGLPPYTDMLTELVGNMLNVLRQITRTSNLFGPVDAYLADFQRSVMPMAPSSPRWMRREVSREPMDDFLDLLQVDYAALFHALSIEPTPYEIIETIHLLFSNPDMAIFVKGLNYDLTGSSAQDETIDTVLGVLSYLTTPSQVVQYVSLFTEIAEDDWNVGDLQKLGALSESLARMIDVAMIMSKQPSLNIAHRVDQIAKQLSSLVDKIVGHQSNTTDLASEFLTALNNILLQNIEEAKDISPQITAILKAIINAASKPGSQMSLMPYMMALDQTVSAFAPILSPENLMYFNISGQMIKGLAMLASYPDDIEKVLHSVYLLSATVNHALAFSGEVSLPGGLSIQEVVGPVVLNSALATHILWNLSSVSHTYSTTLEKQMMIIQSIDSAVSLLPEDARAHTAPLRGVLLSALSWTSSTDQIRPAFMNISHEVTASLLTILNVTQGPVSMDEKGPARILYVVSNLVSQSLFEGLEMASSYPSLSEMLSSLNSAVGTLGTVLPPTGSHYLNVSYQLLEKLAHAVNYTSSTGDLDGALSMLSGFVHTLVSAVQYPGNATATDNAFGELEAALKMALQILMSGGDPLEQAAGVSQQLLHSVHSMLSLASGGTELDLAKLVLGATKMNLGHLLMMNDTNWLSKLPMVLADVTRSLPDGLPYARLIKNITGSLGKEPQGNLSILLEMAQTISELLMTDMWSSNYTMLLHRLSSQLCGVERLDAAQQVIKAFSLPGGLLCQSVGPAMTAIHQLTINVAGNGSELYNVLYELFVGDPATYDIESDWVNVVSKVIGFNVSTLGSLEVNTTAPQASVKVSDLLQNATSFAIDVHKYTQLSPEIIQVLLNFTLPNSNLKILAMLTNLRYCTMPSMMSANDTLLFNAFCRLRPEQWYNFVILFVRHHSVENVIYKLLLSSDMQGLVGVVLQMVHFLTDMMNKLLPAIHRLQEYLSSFGNLNLVADSEFHSLVRGKRSTISSKSAFVAISRALCRNGIMALFGISKLPIMTESDASTKSDHSREELIEKFMIPRDASPFCMNFYLDMVNTTGGAVAWAFLKPMLLGQVLYTPDTPLTREIIRKSNGTLHQFGQLRSFSEDWIMASSYVMKSADLLNKTMPMLKNSLSNPFVQNFIESQTDIDVSLMKDTLQNFSNITQLLEKNKFIVGQITTLSTLMMNLSSCVNFDRYKAMKTVEEMDQRAEVLAETRDLYASIIFKLPQENNSSLPEKVDYTIRMQIDNSMRTDRTRNPFWVRDSYISMTRTQRYNRGFIYLQEAIDRAIIETQLGQPVQEPAVQLQAFPYPCFLKDEYLDSISFAFPLVLMIAWVLFIANFVKKLVQERELRLHEYMRMMGVNPVSHFFAWFIESACFLLTTIVILTAILKVGRVLPHSDAFLLFLYLCNYGLSILAISYLVSSMFNKTNVAGLSGSLIYVICFFPFIVVMSLESNLTLGAKTALSLFSPTCFSYASQYISRYEAKEEGIQWSNAYVSPMAGDSASFGWLNWLLLIDSLVYFIVGAYIRMVFPGKYGIPAPWYFPVMPSFWRDLFGCQTTSKKSAKGLFFANIMQKDPGYNKNKGNGMFPEQEEEFPDMPVGVALHGLTKTYGRRHAIHNLNLAFYEGHVTTLLGHNGAGKTTTMSLLTGLFGPTSGSIDVYGRDMQANIDDIRRDLGVCMQYDVLFDDLTAKEHLLLYGQIKSPHWSKAELNEQVRSILQETGMYAHRHKRACTLSGGMKRKLSISIAFIGGSRLVVLDEPTTGVDPCSRRSIWDIILQHKSDRTIILSTHHLDEAEVLSDRIAFMERGGLKCCGSPFYLKDKLAQGYNLTLTKKVLSPDSEEQFDSAELKAFIQSYLPEARMKEGEVGDVVYSLPPYSSQNAASYRALLTSLDQNLDTLQLGCYGISDTTLEEVFLQLTKDGDDDKKDTPWSISESVLDKAASRDSLPDDLSESSFSFGDKASLTGTSTVRGLALLWQQVVAMVMKRVHHSRRDWKGMFSQVILPVLFVIAAMGLGSIKSNLQTFPEMQISPGLYHTGEQYAFFSNQNPQSSKLVDTMMSYPGIDDVCSNHPEDKACAIDSKTEPQTWTSRGNSSKPFSSCKCSKTEQVCERDNYQPPHMRNPSSQIVYNVTGLDVENYLLSTANDYVRNRYGGWSFGKPLPPDLKMDLYDVPKNRTLTKVWYNPEGHHTMPAYLNSLNNFILRSRLPADKDHRQYSIGVSSHPYPGQVDEEDAMVKGLVNTLVALCVLTGYSIMTASFVVYEVQEHHTGSKRLQHISGISEPFYWTVNFIYDMAIYMVPVALSVAMIAAFQLPAFTERQNLGAVTLLLIMFGFATFPWMYLLTAVFKDAEMAFISYVCINLFISVNTIISTAIVYFLGQLNQHDESIQAVYQTLNSVFLIFPQFSFGNGLMELARVDIQIQILKVYGVDAYKDPFGTDMLGWMFLSLFVQGVLAFTLRLLLNKWLMRKVRKLFCRRRPVPQRASGDEDEDVVAEHRRVDSGAASSDVLQLNQLTKTYHHLSKKVQAVKKLSVGIPAGECFGLLGVNGAGKTTTFKMLTGDISPTGGNVQIQDWDGRMVDIMDCRQKGINIGYCPQVDALDDLLTGEEHLYFYSRIRGISRREMDRVVNYLLRKLELEYHRNNISESYSCGTRRKLSTALALIGHPQILLLDEPSSGMDPRSKRHLWKIISEEVMGKCAVVLTSHSMEECEALCTRLAIMVQGQFRCLGSLQHIKNRFGSGFTVKMYLAVASCDVDVITRFMQQHFPSTYLKDHHSTMVEYHVPIAPGGVADIFDQLESNKTALQIKHFSVSQTTLDEVFINFAMGKDGMEKTDAVLLTEGSDADSLNSFDSVDT